MPKSAFAWVRLLPHGRFTNAQLEYLKALEIEKGRGDDGPDVMAQTSFSWPACILQWATTRKPSISCSRP